MNSEYRLHRDVIVDLLPLYAAGEASGATRTLVERHLPADPSLARLVERLRATALAAPAPTLEDTTFARTRRWLRWRGATMAVAMFLTLSVASFRFDDHGTYWLWQSNPAAAVVVGAFALIAWAAHGWVRMRLRATGL